jgi:hypothetical protein
MSKVNMDDRQMIVLEALRILEKRLRRNIENTEIIIKRAEPIPTNAMLVWQWKDELKEMRARLTMLEEARKEVLER